MIFAYYLFLLLYGFISTITMHTGDIFAYVNVNVVTTEMFYILTINYEIIDHHILMIDFTAHVPLRQAGVTKFSYCYMHICSILYFKCPSLSWKHVILCTKCS